MKIHPFLVIVLTGCSLAFTPGTAGADCGCLASIPPGNHVLLICPQGDGPTLAEEDAVVTIGFTDLVDPEYVTALGGCNGGIVWCSDYPQSDSITGDNMRTTFSGAFAGGGYDTEIRFVVYQFYLPTCWEQYAPLVLVSPDINADLVINIVDLAIFAEGFQSPPRPYDARFDFNGDGTIGLIDFYYFSLHWQHSCS